MKKVLIFLLAAWMTLGLCACVGSKSTVYTITKNGIDYVVDTENNTIFDGTNTYQYTFSGTSSNYEVEITYPDGSNYWWHMQDNGAFSSGAGGWSEDYDANRYVDGDVLCDVLSEEAPAEANSGKTVAIVFLIAVGIFNLASPRTAWELEWGWRFKNAEPSDMALAMNRIGGGIAIVVAVVMIFG